jgi:hypothetical protein
MQTGASFGCITSEHTPIVNGDGFAIDGLPEDECEANGRLIAEAPELLEACKLLLETLNRIKPEGFRVLGQSEALAAIAKAEGK